MEEGINESFVQAALVTMEDASRVQQYSKEEAEQRIRAVLAGDKLSQGEKLVIGLASRDDGQQSLMVDILCRIIKETTEDWKKFNNDHRLASELTPEDQEKRVALELAISQMIKLRSEISWPLDDEEKASLAVPPYRCAACRGMVVISSSLVNDYPFEMQIIGPGWRGQCHKEVAIFCSHCGLIYAFLPPRN